MNKLSQLGYSQKRTTVSLDTHVYKRLRVRGHFGESFSELVTRLLDELDNANRGGVKR